MKLVPPPVRIIIQFGVVHPNDSHISYAKVLLPSIGKAFVLPQ